MVNIAGTFVDVAGTSQFNLTVEDNIITEMFPLAQVPHRKSDWKFGDDYLIFPGMMDVHIHARQDPSGKQNYKEDFQSVGAAALAGGVVHVCDMPNNPEPPVDDESYRRKQELVLAESSPYVDILLYAGIGPGTRPLSFDVPYKAYMGPSVGPLWFKTFEELDETLAHYRGKSVSFHCEDPVMLDAKSTESLHEDKRPPECEYSATKVAIEMIRKYELRGKLCHYSVKDGLPLIRQAREEGLDIEIEVTPHHLYFDMSMITEENRGLMQMNPPLRSPEDREAMIEALRDGTIDYLATDHAPHTLEEKEKGMSGQPHLDTYGAFVTWLLQEKNFSPERIAAVTAANPGQFVNRFKALPMGRTEVGYTGSFTVLKLNDPRVISNNKLKTKCGWSPFDGLEFPGHVAAVFVRGTYIPRPQF